MATKRDKSSEATILSKHAEGRVQAKAKRVMESTSYFPRIRRYAWFVACFWSFTIGILLVLDISNVKRHVTELAMSQTMQALDRDIAYHKWASSHGGVYVPVAEGTSPNPYLAGVPERDITTPSGRNLTLMNPDYMTRQVHGMASENYGAQGHITSLNPIRPQNAPDAWEAEILRSFAQGKSEHSEVLEINGNPHLRVMRALVTETGCLKCHGAEGLKVGDLRGGISVSVPLAPYLSAGRTHTWSMVSGYGTIWALGLLGLGLGTKRLWRHLIERDQAEAALRENRDLLDATQRISQVGGWEWSVTQQSMKWAAETYRIHGFEPGENADSSPELIQRSLACYDTNDRPVIEAAFRRCLEEGEPYDLTFPLTTADGRRIWIQTTAQAVLEGARVVKVVGNIVDITERKRVERVIHESTDRLLAIMNSMESLVYVADMQTHELLFVNDYGRRIWGEDIIGQPCWLALQGSDGSCDFCSNDKLVTADGRPTGVYQWEFQNRVNGRWYELRDRAIPWMDGRLVRMEIATDITERRQAQEALQGKLAELEQMNRLMVGRENKMIELKREINELCIQLSIPKRYSAPESVACESNS